MIFIISSFFIKGSINSQGNIIFLYYTVSIIASVSLVYLTKYLGKRTINVLDFVGKRTLYILIFHFMSFKIVSLVYIVVSKRSFTELSSFPVVENDNNYLWLIYSIVGVLVPLSIKFCIEKAQSHSKKPLHQSS